MNDDRFKEAREFFVAAASMSVDERIEYLDEACAGDADLRAEVEELLRFHDAATGGGSELPTPLHPASILPDAPELIGPYRILQKIGAGGMGEVYEAQQEKPFRRRVALKIIKWGMDTEQVVLRFESERQALALIRTSPEYLTPARLNKVARTSSWSWSREIPSPSSAMHPS